MTRREIQEEQLLRFVALLSELEGLGREAFTALKETSDELALEQTNRTSEKEAYERDITNLHRHVEALSHENVDLQKNLNDVKRNQMLATTRVTELSESLSHYQQNANEVSRLTEKLNQASDEVAQLRLRVDQVQGEGHKQATLLKDQLRCLKLKTDQERALLEETAKSNEAKIRSLTAECTTLQAKLQAAENQLKLKQNDYETVRRQDKVAIDRAKNELERQRHLASTLQTQLKEAQAECERATRKALHNNDNLRRAEISSLKAELQECHRQLSLTDYRQKQVEEDHKKTVTMLREEFQKQLERQVEELRRQLTRRNDD